MSECGVLFTTNEVIPIGTELELQIIMEFEGDQLPSDVHASARVVRVETVPSAPKRSMIAAEILEYKFVPRQDLQDDTSEAQNYSQQSS